MWIKSDYSRTWHTVVYVRNSKTPMLLGKLSTTDLFIVKARHAGNRFRLKSNGNSVEIIWLRGIFFVHSLENRPLDDVPNNTFHGQDKDCAYFLLPSVKSFQRIFVLLNAGEIPSAITTKHSQRADRKSVAILNYAKLQMSFSAVHFFKFQIKICK